MEGKVILLHMSIDFTSVEREPGPDGHTELLSPLLFHRLAPLPGVLSLSLLECLVNSPRHLLKTLFQQYLLGKPYLTLFRPDGLPLVSLFTV